MSNLIVFSAKEADSKRINEEEEHPFRTKFERDRDRILYSVEFRRLSGKTQVFVTGYDDNIRTRMTHTLEVAQISKTISRHLNIDVTLTEAIAFGHDIGHTPFGHVGERTLNLILNGCDVIKNINDFIPNGLKGFKHNWQGLRVAIDLERMDRKYPGLNLTDFTLWGIVNHSKLTYGSCNYYSKNKCRFKNDYKSCKDGTLQLEFYDKYNEYINDNSWTIEALIVNWADEIAQRNHDIQDGLLANIIDKRELVNTLRKVFKEILNKDELNSLKIIEKETTKHYYITLISRFVVNFYVSRLIETCKTMLGSIRDEYNISSDNCFHKNKSNILDKYKSPFDIITYDKKFLAQEHIFHKYIKDRIINSGIAQRMDGKSNYIIVQLVKAYISNPQQLPDATIISIYRNADQFMIDDESKKYPYAEIVAKKRNELIEDYQNDNNSEFKAALLRTICDYIAGMTDQYALDQFELLYGGTGFRQSR